MMLLAKCYNNTYEFAKVMYKILFFSSYMDKVLLNWLVWLSGRTSVSDRRTFTGLHRTCSWWVTIYMREIFTQQTQASANRNARSKQWQPWLAACQCKRLHFLRFSFTQRKRLRLNGNWALLSLWLLLLLLNFNHVWRGLQTLPWTSWFQGSLRAASELLLESNWTTHHIVTSLQCNR